MIAKVNSPIKENDQSTLNIVGEIPKWLEGNLIRNGPITIEVNGKRNAHWFDGLAMLHAFSFHDGKVSYSNKFLRTDAYRKVFDEGSISYQGFAEDPCRSLFKNLISFFIPKKNSPNANINVAKFADEFVALTEIPLPIKFDPKTLKTLGVFDYKDHLPHDKCWESAHPHQNFRKNETINYLIEYGLRSFYTIYKISNDSKSRSLIAKIEVKEPSYMHSFAVTENYIILSQFPFVVKPLDFITKGKAFIKNFQWHPELGTRFIVIEKKSGSIKGTYKTPAFFAFHHVNAFEQDQTIFLDLICYENTDVIFSVADHFQKHGSSSKEKQLETRLSRFFIHLKNETIEQNEIYKGFIEFPRINDVLDGKAYHFVYCVDPREPIEKEESRLIRKINVETGEQKIWQETDCYPGEPVFVKKPNAIKEDEGVVLSIVIQPHLNQSFLLTLDAETFIEIGRAKVEHTIPVGLHGQFYYS